MQLNSFFTFFILRHPYFYGAAAVNFSSLLEHFYKFFYKTSYKAAIIPRMLAVPQALETGTLYKSSMQSYR